MNITSETANRMCVTLSYQSRLVLDRPGDTIMHVARRGPRASKGRQAMSTVRGIACQRVKDSENNPGYQVDLWFKDGTRLCLNRHADKHPKDDLDVQRILAWIEATPRAASLQYPDPETRRYGPRPPQTCDAPPQRNPTLTIDAMIPPHLLLGGLMIGLVMLLYGFDSPEGIVALGGLGVSFGCGFLLAIWEQIELTRDTERQELRLTRKALSTRNSQYHPLNRILGVRRVGRNVMLFLTDGRALKIGNGLFVKDAQKQHILTVLRDWISATAH